MINLWCDPSDPDCKNGRPSRPAPPPSPTPSTPQGKPPHATIAGGLFGEGVKALGEDEWAAHDWTTNNQTQYLIATRDDTCVQIPVVMKNESIFCHGPFPRAEIRSGFLQDWVAGKGSCKEQGFDHGPQDAAANVTGQTDMHQCHFKNWDFDHLLPLNERQSSWYKKVTHSHVFEH